MKYRRLFFIAIFAFATLLCMAACGPDSGNRGGTSYEISVKMQDVSVDEGEITVCLYTLDGTAAGSEKLTNGKAVFDLEGDAYIATLAGLPDTVSFSSVLLTKENKKATVTLGASDYDSYTEKNIFAFTLFLFAGQKDAHNLYVQVCDDELCRSPMSWNDHAGDVRVSLGQYEIKVYDFSAVEQEIYHEIHTVSLDRRFFVIQL